MVWNNIYKISIVLILYGSLLILRTYEYTRTFYCKEKKEKAKKEKAKKKNNKT